jgi:hypothetical protein
MRRLATFVFSLVLLATLAPARAQVSALPDANAVHQLADDIANHLGTGSFDAAMVLIRRHLAAPPERLKEIEIRFSTAFASAQVEFGNGIGKEMIKQGRVGDALIRDVYLVKYERGAVRWNFLFYKRKDGWVLNEAQLEGNLNTLFAE